MTTFSARFSSEITWSLDPIFYSMKLHISGVCIPLSACWSRLPFWIYRPIQIFTFSSISPQPVIQLTRVIHQRVDLDMCYISFSNNEHVWRISEDVMTKLLKFCQLLPSGSHTRHFIDNICLGYHRSTFYLHFLYSLLWGTLWLERVMIDSCKFSSLSK